MTTDEFLVVEMMEKRGGGFVKALAACFRHADSVNFEKLKTCFSGYWEEYEALSKRRPK